ncbi:McrB family protein [Minwuia thermotolerans]|uniref:McrB family protein n=1 Tax=Minwuia thermotolerans TaxID=2056226 RepID=UPI000D6DC56B|nr:hypothetical protein [Minwuia thermotolerans]
MIPFLDPTSFAVVVAAVASGSAVVIVAYLGTRFIVDSSRLPAAVRDAELLRRVGANEDRLQYLEEQIREREVTLAERDQAEAEAEYWRTQVETHRAEYANLGDQRAEIEEVREEHRQAVEALAAKETEWRRVIQEIEAVREERKAAETRIKEAEERLAEIADKEKYAAELEERLEALRAELTEVAGEVDVKRQEMSALRLQEENLNRETARLADSKERLAEQVSEIRQEIEQLEPSRAEVAELNGTRDELKARSTNLEEEIDKLEARKDRLEARVARLQEEADVEVDGAGHDARVLQDLRTAPSCLYDEAHDQVVWPKEQGAETEMDALARVEMLLQESGLEFSRRTINAFHTSLKTAVISPLTVLAGISGTGKSQLPRRYADAMGMHFLKIPVQPRWDGPQDLFGFYNYIEKRYKATDLARALVHLDPYNWPDEAKRFEDRMLLVLLDEMNLARVEYYFSEFLSRLEGRPMDERAADERERAPAEISVDVSHKGQPMRVYAGQNVLFAGTMNEDESTLALSDKVMDRANILRFPRPAELREELPDADPQARATGYLPKSRWTRNWMREADALDASGRDRAGRVIEEINGVMDELGRPFGHRMSQAMLHYVANYPAAQGQTNNTAQVDNALADQLEQRIMPKLRGVDAGADRAALQKLAEIAGDRLNDQQLGKAIDEAVDRANRSIGIFNWRGLQRTGN